MEDLKALIEKADDDYLIGLSNKGTVKRAYKDLEQESPTLTWQGEEAAVGLREENCMLKIPLGESICSCPSRSICRHIVTAVLWMKKEIAAQKGASGQEGAETTGQAQEESPGRQPAAIRKKGDARILKEEADGGETAGQAREEVQVLAEILEIPPERLKRACGNKRFERFLGHMRAGELPPVKESSIVTVTLPWEKETVKLLEPAGYSACSCHSRELCAHKAQAMLAYQLLKKKYTLEELESSKEPETVWERALVEGALRSICEEICHQLCTGLSRTSKESAESLLRLALIAHRAGLPAIESGLREAASCYEQYFSRSAAFRGEELMEKLLNLYQTALKLGRAESEEEIRRLAGTFRDSYLLVGTLHLMGMGARTFISKTGYEGEIYYFLETREKKWYTWTDARPTFYEGKKVTRRPSENAPAPWELNCSRQQLQSLLFDLSGAKAASGGRLSVSKESRGETVGVRSPGLEEAWDMIFWDYEKMVIGCLGQKEAERIKETGEVQERRESLVLAGALDWDEASFDKVRQRFSWNIYDEKGRGLSIALNYTKEEGLVIRLLERLEQRLRDNRPQAIVFFGSFYLDEEGKPCLYPIEFYTGVLPSGNCEGTGVPEWKRKYNGEEISVDSLKLPPKAVINSMEQYFGEVDGFFGDLLVSGLYSLQEETLSWCRKLGEEGEQMGLHQAGRDLAEVYGLLEGRRHQMDFAPEPVMEVLCRVKTYVKLCRERILRDKALLSIKINKG